MINNKFYEGYEGEPLIILAIEDKIYIWDGYFEYIFGNPSLKVDWKGFTRDYNQQEGAFYIKINFARLFFMNILKI